MRWTLPVILPSLMMRSAEMSELPESNCSVRTTEPIQMKKKLKDYISSSVESTEQGNQLRDLLSNLRKKTGLWRLTKCRYLLSGIHKAKPSDSGASRATSPNASKWKKLYDSPRKNTETLLKTSRTVISRLTLPAITPFSMNQCARSMGILKKN